MARSLHGLVASIKRIELPGLLEKGDVSDWVRGRNAREAVSELRAMINSAPEWTPLAASQPTDPTMPRFSLTDTGNAELLAHLAHGHLKYDYCRGAWLLYRGHWWEADPKGEVYRLAMNAARTRYKGAANINDLERRKAEAKWAIQSESRQRIEAAVTLARSEQSVADSGDGWDCEPWLLGVRNGVVDLRTGELRPGRPEDRIALHAAVCFDTNAKSTRWERFLFEVFEENINTVEFVARAVGYSITGLTSEQVLFLCYGSGANGKGVLMRVLHYVLGDYAHNLPFTALEREGRASIPTDMADLVGKRFVTASETNEGRRLNEARVKALVHGDPMTARHLFCRAFTYQPNAKLWLAANHKPRVSDDSFGFWRSVLLVPFRKRFEGQNDDKNLIEYLIKHESAGVLAWVVRGCLAWQRHGLRPPNSIIAATRVYRSESDLLESFIRMRCERGDFESRAGELFKAYSSWADDEAIPQRERLGSRTFGERMAERFRKHERNAGNYYVGVRLRVEGVDRKASTSN